MGYSSFNLSSTVSLGSWLGDWYCIFASATYVQRSVIFNMSPCWTLFNNCAVSRLPLFASRPWPRSPSPFLLLLLLSSAAPVKASERGYLWSLLAGWNFLIGRPRLSQIRTKPALKALNPSNPWAMFGGAAAFTLPQELRSNKDLFLAAWFGRSAENNKGSF